MFTDKVNYSHHNKHPKYISDTLQIWLPIQPGMGCFACHNTWAFIKTHSLIRFPSIPCQYSDSNDALLQALACYFRYAKLSRLHAGVIEWETEVTPSITLNIHSVAYSYVFTILTTLGDVLTSLLLNRSLKMPWRNFQLTG